MEYHRINHDDAAQKLKFIEYVKSLRGQQEHLTDFVGEKRSNDLNRYYRVRLTLVSQSTGHSVPYLHKHFKRLYSKRVKLDPNSKESTADMSEMQMLAYLDYIEEWEIEFFKDDQIPDDQLEFMSIT